MTNKVLRTAIIAAVLLAIIFISGMYDAEGAHAAVDKKAAAKAKTYTKKANKIFAISGAKYCFASKKVKKGLQKVGKKYYFFNKSTGKMEKNTAIKKGGKYYYFAKNGARYDYGYRSAGSSKANIAAGIVISGAKIKPSGKGTAAEMTKAYKWIINKVKYTVLLDPDLGSSKWIGDAALKAADEKKAKCYGYAALTYSTFKALGANPTLAVGTCNTAPAKNAESFTSHAWVEMVEADATLIYDSVYDATRGKDMSFFAKTKTASANDTFTIEGKDYIYKQDKVAAK